MPVADLAEEPHHDGKHDVEGDLRGDAPRLREGVEFGAPGIRLDRERLRNGGAYGRLGQCDDDGQSHPVGRQHASTTTDGVRLEVGAAVTGVRDEMLVEEESREGEEDRDAEVPATGESPQQPAVHGEAREVGRMRGHDEERGHRAQSVQRRDAARSCRHPRPPRSPPGRPPGGVVPDTPAHARKRALSRLPTGSVAAIPTSRDKATVPCARPSDWSSSGSGVSS